MYLPFEIPAKCRHFFLSILALLNILEEVFVIEFDERKQKAGSMEVSYWTVSDVQPRLTMKFRNRQNGSVHWFSSATRTWTMVLFAAHNTDPIRDICTSFNLSANLAVRPTARRRFMGLLKEVSPTVFWSQVLEAALEVLLVI